jgi:hypothetical protein
MENNISFRRGGAGALSINNDELGLGEGPEGHQSDATARLPPELLGAIFTFGNMFEERSESFKKHFPLVVSQVSARWRDVALHTSSLWKDIFIQGNLVTATELVDAYLERSRGCLLDIDLDLDNCMTAEVWAERIECQLDRIVEHVGRWRHLAVHGTWRAPFLTFAGRLRNSYAPFLESIAICWNVPHDDADEHIILGINVFTSGCPRLSSLFLSEVDFIFFQPPLASITSFTLGYSCDGYSVSFSAFGHALMHMPRLRQLYVDVNNVELPEDSVPIEIPSLISLEIRATFMDSSEVPDLLSCLGTPGIESLLLDEYMDENMPSLANFFRLSHASRKYPSLRALELRNAHITTSRAAELFASIPFVVHISLTDSIWDLQRGNNHAVLEALAANTIGGDVLWPNLRSITLTSVIEGDISMLRAVISHRIRKGRPPLSLTIPKPCRPADSQDLEWLQQHIEAVFVRDPVDVTWSSCSARSMHAYSYRRLK